MLLMQLRRRKFKHLKNMAGESKESKYLTRRSLKDTKVPYKNPSRPRVHFHQKFWPPLIYSIM